jgi:hypothetical protein
LKTVGLSLRERWRKSSRFVVQTKKYKKLRILLINNHVGVIEREFFRASTNVQHLILIFPKKFVQKKKKKKQTNKPQHRAAYDQYKVVRMERKPWLFVAFALPSAVCKEMEVLLILCRL